jgi:hypothetical protein
MRSRRFGHKECAIYVGVYCPAPRFGIYLVKRLTLADENIAYVLHPDTGIVDDTVNRAEVLDRRVDDVLTVTPPYDVAFYGQKAIRMAFTLDYRCQFTHVGRARRQMSDNHSNSPPHQR